MHLRIDLFEGSHANMRLPAVRGCRRSAKAGLRAWHIAGMATAGALLLGLLAAPALADKDDHRGGKHLWPSEYKVPTAPAEYLALTNPFTSEQDLARGAKLFAAKCAECHGDEGEGDDDEPDVVAFKNKAWMKTRPDGQLFYIVKEGAGPDSEMEAFGPDSDAGLSEQKLWQIIAFIRTLAKDDD